MLGWLTWPADLLVDFATVVVSLFVSKDSAALSKV